MDSHELLIILQRAPRKTYPKAYQCIRDGYIYHLQKIIIIPVLCQYGLPIHICASENAIVSKDMIF